MEGERSPWHWYERRRCPMKGMSRGKIGILLAVLAIGLCIGNIAFAQAADPNAANGNTGQTVAPVPADPAANTAPTDPKAANSTQTPDPAQAAAPTTPADPNASKTDSPAPVQTPAETNTSTGTQTETATDTGSNANQQTAKPAVLSLEEFERQVVASRKALEAAGQVSENLQTTVRQELVKIFADGETTALAKKAALEKEAVDQKASATAEVQKVLDALDKAIEELRLNRKSLNLTQATAPDTTTGAGTFNP